MPIQKFFLRAFRRRTDITQSDIMFLLNQPDCSTISRCEKGKRPPSVDMLLLYHLLFEIPISTLIEYHKDDLNEDLIIRIGLLLKKLEGFEQTEKVQSRIAFLSSTLTRLVS